MSWKKLRTKKILDHPRLQVYEDQIELPSGKQSDYIYFKGNDAGLVIAINDQGQVLLQKEYSYPVDTWLYQFPGGALEAGETPVQGAAREFAEEAKLQGILKSIGWFYTNNRRSNSKLHVFVAHDLKSAPRPQEPHEAFEDHWLTPQEINKLIATGELNEPTALASWALYLQTLA